ncbi:YgjP-like metallopeptidase domain-containing protein [Ramlibacter sp. 2FC]|uniref:YgjP-like metallopeptidase domain-containing protein n=1 Tax=Ramlibacter sp. 2FC TaxID=2502188 RepID=UPI00201E18F5|nr:YgjP-like metallopeptidase domain-containing protein [Ramlibacter sp. 2FC]
MSPLPYLQAYPEDLRNKVRQMLEQQGLAAWLRRKYPGAHGIRTDGGLYQYVSSLKNEFMRSADAVSKVTFDSKIHVIRNALGLHSTVARVQGSRLKAKREIRVAALFRDTPIEFLRMIAVHELAHLREREHGRAFYQLCEHMEPAYHQLELDLRLYLTHLDQGGERLWGA